MSQDEKGKEVTGQVEAVAPPGWVRVAALIFVMVCALGSVVCMIAAGTGTPRLLLVGFIFWILSPFAVLGWANLASRRWPAVNRVALYIGSVMISAVSLAAYTQTIDIAPPGSANAFRFVITAPVSMFAIVAALFTGALIARLRRPTGDIASKEPESVTDDAAGNLDR